MIYLIGGPPKCGKTTLAKHLARKYHFPWISADTLQNIARAYIPKENHAALFPHACLRGESNDEFYAQNSTQKIVKDYIKQGETTYAAISMMAETYLKDKDDVIVEGYEVTPAVVAQIIQRFGPENIRALFLVKYDEQKFVQDVHKSTTSNDWIIRKTKDAATYGKIAKMVSEYSHYFETQSNKYGFRVFVMDGEFEEQLSEIEQWRPSPF